MQVKSLRRTVLAARWGTVALVLGGLAACAGVIGGGDLPLTAILWCMVLWPLAGASLVVWITASSMLRRHASPPPGFEVITHGAPEEDERRNL
jgi:hypothetical protein